MFRLIFLSLTFNIVFNYNFSYGQCTGAVANTGTTSITPTTAWQTVVFNSGDVRYIEFSATTGNTYVFTCRSAVGGSAASVDEQFSLLNSSNDADGGLYFTSFMNDFTSGSKELFAWSPNSNGTYRIALSLYTSSTNCQNLASDYTVAYVSFPLVENFCFWMGVTSTAWSNGNNWYRRATSGYPSRNVPTSSRDVIIPSGSSNQPSVGSGTAAITKSLTINSGATLINGTTFLDIGSFDIYGNFTNNGTFNHTGNLFTYMNSSGTLGGTGTFSTTAIYIYDETVTLNNNITLQEIEIFDDGVTFLNLDSYTLSVTDYLTQSGTVNLGTGKLSYLGADGDMTLNNTRFTENAGTFNYARAGTQTVLGAITYHHLEISGSNTKTLNANTDVNGNLTITAGTLASTSTHDITVAGNWTNNGTAFTHANRRVTFDGSAAQTISGSTATTFHDVTINNSSGDVALSVNATINGTLTMTNGDLVIATTKVLTLDDNDDPGISGGSATTHIVTNGTATVVKTYTSTTAITFPFGNGTYYRPITLTPSNAGSTVWTMAYSASAFAPSTVDGGSGLDHISKYEYWTCNRGGGSPSPAVMALTWMSNSDVNDYTNLAIGHYDGTDWDEVASTPVGSNSGGTLTSDAAISVFSPFTIASTSGNNPLPIELLFFNAQVFNADVALTWSTAAEINNDFFTVEKSLDGLNFEYVAEIKGAGNSNQTLNYSMLDNNPYSGISYYRLKQTDFNGTSSYSKIINVEVVGTNDLEFTIYNNYDTQQIELKLIDGDVDLTYSLKLYNYLGQLVYENDLLLPNGLNCVIPMLSSTSRVYFVSLSDGTNMVHKKFIW